MVVVVVGKIGGNQRRVSSFFFCLQTGLRKVFLYEINIKMTYYLSQNRKEMKRNEEK